MYLREMGASRLATSALGTGAGGAGETEPPSLLGARREGVPDRALGSALGKLGRGGARGECEVRGGRAGECDSPGYRSARPTSAMLDSDVTADELVLL